MVAVWLTGRTKAFAPGNFRNLVTTTCGVVTVGEVMTNLSLSPAMVGGGLFTMDGQLLALILPCGDRFAAIQPSSVDEMLRRASMIDERVLARFGILFSPLTDHERSYYRDAEGLLVREVWRGTAGDAAGLRPGDIVTALNATPVGALDDLRGLEARTGTAVAVGGWRRGSAHTWSVMSGADPAPTGATGATAGVILEPAPSPYRIRSVVAGSRAERVGVRAGDRIVRIDGAEPRSQRALDRSLMGTTADAILLEIERDERRIAVIIPAGESR
jgi:membrane-associated protease RseP (regulator of RpoE activity)